MSYQGGPMKPPSQSPRSPTRWPPPLSSIEGAALYVLGPILTVFTVVLIIAGAISGRGTLGVLFGPTPTITPWPTTTAAPAATITPEGTPLPTDTPTSSAPAVLGATEGAFTAQYGSPELRGPVPWYSITAPDGTQLALCVCDLTAGIDGQDRVDILSFGPASSTNLSPDQAAAVAKSLSPADAVYVDDIQDPDVGTLHVYRSAALATAFPASDFENTGPSGGLVPPGTFIIACEIPGPPGCNLRLGT